MKSTCFTMDSVVQFWRASLLEQSAAWGKLTMRCIPSGCLPPTIRTTHFPTRIPIPIKRTLPLRRVISTLRTATTVHRSYRKEGDQAVPSDEQSLLREDHKAGKNQTLVFVHSRKDPTQMAKFLKDMSVEKETITEFVKADGATREILTEANNAKGSNLRDLLPFGFGLLHAGIPREERSLVKELFADGSFQVLVCTVTLAGWVYSCRRHGVRSTICCARSLKYV
ncbi:hypothetical protein ARMSODRAFT_193843 [Armillaria solidipes]|uniref:Helicase C-terminal domain-containing protein n=1 Tax=Armillaria solidipes TaxID=1076256 RepID=A0A2H3BPB8_9AGAR|nr:hypothetical protein ARMSODRAFT_193843 [Armillaria solidipes]